MRPERVCPLLLGSILLWVGLQAAGQVAPLTCTDSFDSGAAAWDLRPRANWAVQEGLLTLRQPGPQTPPVRRPGAYALLKDRVWREVTLEARVQSLRPASVKGRDVCVLFGYQDETHFYYAHLSNDSNGQTHNVIVKVDGAQRQAITTEKRPEPRLTDGWHVVRVVHHADGRIAVYMDDMQAPLLTAQDSRYAQGAVGLGTFDDPAQFDDVTVSGQVVPPRP